MMKETNMEHYRGEIEEFVKNNREFGVKNGVPVDCHIVGCSACEILCDHCAIGTIKWLMSEYKPEPVLTVKEKGFVECIEDGWLARDKDNELNWYEIEPRKDGFNGWWDEHVAGATEINKDFFPFITWEDEEPWAVEDLRKLKVQDAD